MGHHHTIDVIENILKTNFVNFWIVQDFISGEWFEVESSCQGRKTSIGHIPGAAVLCLSKEGKYILVFD